MRPLAKVRYVPEGKKWRVIHTQNYNVSMSGSTELFTGFNGLTLLILRPPSLPHPPNHHHTQPEMLAGLCKDG